MTLIEMMKLQEEYGATVAKSIRIHDDPDSGNEYTIAYNNVIVGSELVTVDFVKQNIENVKRMLTEERYEKHQKLVRKAQESGYGYGDTLTMMMDLELCDETFELDLDDMLDEWYSELEYFWCDLPHFINRETNTFNGWVPTFATKVTYSKYEKEAMRLINEDYFSVPQVIGFVYDLYQDCQINEPEETYLYNLLDPEEKYNEPSEYRNAWHFDNPLVM